MAVILDHLAIAGETLEAAVAHVEDSLGVALHPGGKHARYGTWNQLLGLADGLYLEAIAIDPEAPAPGGARWFDLDRFAGPPRIANWICATDDLDATLSALPAGAGRPVALERGDLAWRMAVPPDGRLPFDGAFPAILDWARGLHPSRRLPDSGCRLAQLTIAHPDAEALCEVVLPRLADSRIRIETGPMRAFSAEFDTPSGRRVLQ